MSSSVLKKKWLTKLKEIQDDLKPLSFSSNSKEVNEACGNWYSQLSKDNPNVSSSRLWKEVINPKRIEIAKQLSEQKQKSVRSQLNEIFSSTLCASMSSSIFSSLIDSFINENSDPLADALTNREKMKAINDINKIFPTSSPIEIALAIDDNTNAAAKVIATNEARSQLMQQKKLKEQQESGFITIKLGAHEKPVDLKGNCFWVPASVRHEVRQSHTGLTRHSFFVYGGVNVQPRVNLVQGKNAPLSGSSVGGGAFNRTQITFSYGNAD